MIGALLSSARLLARLLDPDAHEIHCTISILFSHITLWPLVHTGVIATLLTSAHLLTYLESRVTSDISCPLSQTLDDTLDNAPDGLRAGVRV